MKALAPAAIAALSLGGATAQAANYTYTGERVTRDIIANYTIVTDADTGLLSGSDIVSFNFDLDSLSIGEVKFNNNNGFFSGFFAATPTELQYTHPVNDNIQSDTFFGPEYDPDTVDYDNTVDFEGDETRVNEGNGNGSDSGFVNASRVIATISPTISAAPEPSTWVLMVAGIGGVGLMLRRAKQTMGFRFKDALSA